MLLDEGQEALSCALIGKYSTHSGQASHDAPALETPAEDEKESPSPTAKPEHTHFEAWVKSADTWDIPLEIMEVLRPHRTVFPGTLRAGLPQKHPHDHHILLVFGSLQAKSAIYRMTPDLLNFHRQVIAKLSADGWIGPTYLPICSPTIMVDTFDDGSGERKMLMVVNYQALNAFYDRPWLPVSPYSNYS
ncbi:Reverse transcriptase, related [Eimeria brunetti]|uniref:Reverse transcriptase, related n=1 Tax=Eimeria brunetti TaxID=51314 RepID=U6LWI7_9EIME|nr:Reverse transcriptase, related [Eimeria brunetti]